jgi:hypothetical protein
LVPLAPLQNLQHLAQRRLVVDDEHLDQRGGQGFHDYSRYHLGTMLNELEG